MLAVDVSSHQPTDLTYIVQQTRAKHVCVKLYLPEESPPQTHSIAQIESARALGCTVSAYIWAYPELDPVASVCSALDVCDWAQHIPYILWLDCEPYEGGPMPSEAWIHAAIGECHRQHIKPGIYTGQWCWSLGPAFAHIPLWDARHDYKPKLTRPVYGGWKSCAAKQFEVRILEDGSKVDMNVWNRRYIG
jgi:hypothetical protein